MPGDDAPLTPLEQLIVEILIDVCVRELEGNPAVMVRDADDEPDDGTS